MSTRSTSGRLAADLARARAAVDEAERASQPEARFLAGHLAALRVAAVVLSVGWRPVRADRPRDAWATVAEVAPELGAWAAFFGATASRRAAVGAALDGGGGERAGGGGPAAGSAVTVGEADAVVRGARRFLELVTALLVTAVLDSPAADASPPRTRVPELLAAQVGARTATGWR